MKVHILKTIVILKYVLIEKSINNLLYLKLLLLMANKS